MLCGAVEKAWIGRRHLWLHCTLPANHLVYTNGLWDEQASPHWDSKRRRAWTGPVIEWWLAEPGRATNVGSVPTKRKTSEDRTTAEHVTRTGQADLFRTTALEQAHAQMMEWIDEEIARCQPEEYHGEF